MQAALDAAWNNPNKTAEQDALQKQLVPNGKTPDADDFIQLLCGGLGNLKK